MRGAGDLRCPPTPAARRDIPDATVARLPEYLRALTGLAERGIPSVSSEELAAAAGVRSAKLRKDLSHLGSYGVRGVGYEVEHLAYRDLPRSSASPRTGRWPSSAWATSATRSPPTPASPTRGFRVVALLDQRPRVVGEADRRACPCSPMADLDRARRRAAASPSASSPPPPPRAQAVCDALVAAGVRSVLTSPRACSPCPTAWTCARSTCPPSCRSSPSTSSARPSRRRGALPAGGALPVSLVVLGLSHHTAPLPLLEAVALDADGRPRSSAAALAHGENVAEAVVLSRATASRSTPSARTFHGAVTDIADALAEACRRRPRATCASTSTCTTRTARIAHAFTVACGLDSMAVGEAPDPRPAARRPARRPSARATSAAR